MGIKSPRERGEKLKSALRDNLKKRKRLARRLKGGQGEMEEKGGQGEKSERSEKGEIGMTLRARAITSDKG